MEFGDCAMNIHHQKVWLLFSSWRTCSRNVTACLLLLITFQATSNVKSHKDWNGSLVKSVSNIYNMPFKI